MRCDGSSLNAVLSSCAARRRSERRAPLFCNCPTRMQTIDKTPIEHAERARAAIFWCKAADRGRIVTN
ncbi:lipoprotein, putative [Burkholderia mallei ATCC 23344]|uniref:Lipoprotein n=2 Tax=Burkholderia mallei TaxID=13373 RepID=A0AAX1X979_BURML|nr:lipoprotein, putative [Burkholderia mallei ATCC 23344]RKN93501.1 hypothetical protein D8O03_27185 [Burkholderia mallei]RPA05878.1 hypothetical protein EGT58_016375 [Burkholderia mallei]RPA16313.1 hypothetical protein EGT61_017725 [Burkholderia mallei]RPA27138.1 hypothetical protein EGT70_22590 [Burkholderia mallei]